MKLRDRLSIYSVLIFSVLILIVSGIIYFTFYSIMKEREIKSLESKSLLAAVFYLEQDELTSSEHDNIKSQLFKTISRKNIIVYNVNNDRVHGEMVYDNHISPAFLSQVKLDKQASFKTDLFFYNGIFYHDNQGDFIVVARESLEDFKEQMNSLLYILIIVSVIGVVIIFIFSRYLGYIAYYPLNQFIDQIKNRNGINFNVPIKLEDSYTEIKELSKTYNQFINQVDQTFQVQKNFIDYVSHELRTPITALMGTLEVTNQKERSVQEYEQTIDKLKQYTNDLQETIDQMMLLSGAKTNFEFQWIRIDEVIWEIIENQIVYYQANIKVSIDVKDDKLLIIKGNESLLNLAINNLIVNAIKYSDNQQVDIQFSSDNQQLVLKIIDTGIGIKEDEMEHIRQNFYRGKNTENYQGKGIGLSIADIIFKLHNIDLTIEHNIPKGTIMILKFDA